MTKPDFSKIFAQNGAVSALTDSQFLQGLEYLGDNPPTKEEFNWLFQQFCEKFKWLNENTGLNLRQNTTAYLVGDIVYSVTLPSYAYAECTQEGITATTEPIWPAVGEEVADGTVKWRVRDIKQAENLAQDLTNKQDKVKYIMIIDKKTSGTSGGTFTAGAWRTRDLNSIEVDETGQVTLSNNQITLTAGIYEVDISVPARACDQHKLRLYNITSSNVIALGTSEYSPVGYAGNSRSILKAKITLSTTTVLEIQHYCTSTCSSVGLGEATGISGVDEIYTNAVLRKVG